MTHLEVQPDGRIFVIDGMPEEPKNSIYGVPDPLKYEAYEAILASAPRILVSDQEQAVRLIWQHVFHFKGLPYKGWFPALSIYQVPVEWERQQKHVQVNYNYHPKFEVHQVAILKESPKGITIDDIKAIKDELGTPDISGIRIVENSVLPDDMMVVSSYLFKRLKP